MAVHNSSAHLYGPGITRIAVTGFKSLANKTDVEIRPLTVLAGANSSGKSSLMQPLLLMKQTFDNERIPPGPFWLWGELARYTTADQFLSNLLLQSGAPKRLAIELEAENNWAELSFGKGPDSDLAALETASRNGLDGRVWRLNAESSEEALKKIYESVVERQNGTELFRPMDFIVHQDRCFLGVGVRFAEDAVVPVFHRPEILLLRNKIQDMIHVPGLRGSFEREFYLHGLPSGSVFPGDFEEYVPSTVYHS